MRLKVDRWNFEVDVVICGGRDTDIDSPGINTLGIVYIDNRYEADIDGWIDNYMDKIKDIRKKKL